MLLGFVSGVFKDLCDLPAPLTHPAQDPRPFRAGNSHGSLEWAGASSLGTVWVTDGTPGTGAAFCLCQAWGRIRFKTELKSNLHTQLKGLRHFSHV